MIVVHAADLHLDSPQRGLERYEGAPVEHIRGATRRALENLVDLCLETEASLLLLAGDLYDGNWRDYSTGLFFSNQMARLRQGGVRVAWIRGNHDAASQITRYLELPDNVQELPTGAPATIRYEDLGVFVHGQGYPTRAVTEDLATRYPDAVAGVLNVGLLHTSLGGYPDHEPYAPCSLETLKSKGYDYWALGHVHARAVLCEDPWVVYPGNLQGRHGREVGEKGATVVSVTDGRVQGVAHRALDVVRWSTESVDISEASTAADVVDLAKAQFERLGRDAEGRLMAVRLRLWGSGPAHAAIVRDPEKWTNELRAAAVDAAGDTVWLERVLPETRASMDAARLALRDDPIGEVVRALSAPEPREALVEVLSELNGKLPLEVREGADELSADNEEVVASIVSDVRHLLLSRLLDAGDDE